MVELTSRTSTITRQYLERFGRVRVGVYHLVISQKEPFSSFLNSLMITLRRKDLLPCYAWFSTALPNSRYLILWCNGYFKTDMSDVFHTVQHIGSFHQLHNLCEVDCLTGDAFAIEHINTRLNNLIALNYVPANQFHQRSFGTSVSFK